MFNVGSGVWLGFSAKGILKELCIPLNRRSILFITHITKFFPITGQLRALDFWLSSAVTALVL